MRAHGLTLSKAARAAGTTPTTVRKYAPQALRRIEGDGYGATRSDRYARKLYFLTARGKVVVTVRDSRVASLIAKHWAAVDYYLKTGRTDRLRPFRGVVLRERDPRLAFLTDPTTLSRLGHAGEVTFEELYALRA
jgi:hypothetical protein